MLSMRSRDDRGRVLGFGGRGVMAEDGYEGVEASSGAAEDGFINPDVHFSYIDEKLQYVLGHFMKDFQGIISAENLGAKFGAHGSFLPADQTSSVQSRLLSPEVTKYNQSSKDTHHSPPVKASALSKNNTVSTAQPLKNPGETDKGTNSRVPGSNPTDNNKPVKTAEPNSLKVRLKVGPANTSARKNADIYIGLGLDVSPFSSPEGATDSIKGFSPELQVSYCGSPLMIFEVMTSFPGMRELLLSPLPNRLLLLSEKRGPYLKSCEIGTVCKGIPDACAFLPDLISSTGELKGHKEKKIKCLMNERKLLDLKSSTSKADVATPLKSKISIETPAGRDLVSTALNIPLVTDKAEARQEFLSNASGLSALLNVGVVDGKKKRETIGGSAKHATGMPDLHRDLNQASVKGDLFLPVETGKNVCAVTGNMKNDVFIHSGNESMHLKGKLCSKISLSEKAIEDGKVGLQSKASHNLQQEGMGKIEKHCEIVKASSDGLKGKKGNLTCPVVRIKKKFMEKSASHDQETEKKLQHKDMQSDAERKSKGSQSNGTVSTMFLKNDPILLQSTPSKERSIISQTRENCCTNTPKVLKYHKESGTRLGDNFHIDGLGSGLLKDGFKHKLKEANIEMEKSKEMPSGESKASFKVPTVNPLTSALIPDAVTVNNSRVSKPYKSSKNLGYDFHGDGLRKETKLEVKKSKEISSGQSEASVKVTAVASLTSAPISDAVCANNSMFKFHKELNKSEGKVHGDGLGSLKAEKLDNGAGLLRKPLKCKLKETKFEAGKSKEMPSGKSEVSVRVLAASPPTSGPTLDLVAGSNEPEDQWVLCDICQNWRLLPYGTNVDDLPKKWKCHMQTWLPGLNKCGISEEDTKNAFYALYQVPLLVNSSNLIDHNALATSAFVVEQNLPTNRNVPSSLKRKHTPNDTLTGHNNLPVDKFSDPVYSQQLHNKSKCLHTPLGSDSFNRADFDQMSNSAEVTVQKRQHKEKERCTNSRHSYDQANSIPQSSSCLKTKFKRELDGETLGISKRIKIHGSCYLEDRHFDLDIAGKDGDLLQTEGKYLKNKDNIFSADAVKSGDSKDKKKPKAQVPIMPNGECRDNLRTSDFERADQLNLASKKRKIKDWPESPYNQENLVSSHHYNNNGINAKEKLHETGLGKEKKVRVLKLKGMESHSTEAGSTMHRKEGITRILLSGGREKLADGANRSASATCKVSEEEQWGKVPSQHGLRGNDCLQRGTSNSRHARSATSSSSNVSGSNKSKSNIQETRGSPAVSVCSSPSKISKSGKLTARRYSERKNDSKKILNDDAIELGFSECLNDEFDHTNTNDKFESRKEKVSSVLLKSSIDDKTAESDDGCSLRGTCYQVPRKLSGSKLKGGIHLKSARSIQQSLSPTELEETKLTIDSANASDNGNVQDMERVNNHLTTDELRKSRSGKRSSGVFGGQRMSESAPYKRNDKLVDKDNSGKSSRLLNCIDRSETTSGRGRQASLLPIQDTQQTQLGGPHRRDTQPECRLDELPLNVAKSNAPNVIRLPRKTEGRNVSHYSSLRHTTLDMLSVQSPTIKKDQFDESYDLKDTRDFVHAANLLKDEGLELESTSMYFQAALRFLHLGFRWEPSSINMNRCEEGSQSTRMYIEAARLCEICAVAFERLDNMATAAIAYKCMEVAYFKVAYLKHPIVSKDRHGLQTALQMVLLGESPSSSASDVENANNQSTLDETALAKSAGSPQIAGNHVIPARYHPIYTRWLNYTNETFLAFEASRKSRNALAGLVVSAASMEKEKNTPSCVQKVLDLNFHNVEELLRLIRLLD